jgi:hypothetical protein
VTYDPHCHLLPDLAGQGGRRARRDTPGSRLPRGLRAPRVDRGGGLHRQRRERLLRQAQAELDATARRSGCGTYICVDTAYQGRDYVQDITVTTRDGLPGTLRGFVGDYRGSKAGVSRWRFIVNREIRAYPTLRVCGGLDRGGRVIENHCVLIPCPPVGPGRRTRRLSFCCRSTKSGEMLGGARTVGGGSRPWVLAGVCSTRCSASCPTSSPSAGATSSGSGPASAPAPTRTTYARHWLWNRY